MCEILITRYRCGCETNSIATCSRCPESGLYKYCPVYTRQKKKEKRKCNGEGGWGSCPSGWGEVVVGEDGKVEDLPPPFKESPECKECKVWQC